MCDGVLRAKKRLVLHQYEQLEKSNKIVVANTKQPSVTKYMA
jgi:hypothetical protein